MIVAKLSDMTRGWFVGNFTPTVLPSNDVEVAIKSYKAGDKEDKHYHKIATEITAVVSGTVSMNNQIFHAGDIITVEPNETVEFSAITDAVNVVVKMPCVLNDKYLE